MYCGVVAYLQADAGNSEDPDNQRSSWFTDPGASNAAETVRQGVGKYIKQAVLDAPLGAKPAAVPVAADAAAIPAAKKQKVPQPFTNFDAW